MTSYTRTSIAVLGIIFAATVVTAPLTAQEKISPEHEAFFETNIRPALVKYCYECHSLDGGKTLGGLLVDTREAIREGGSSGPAVEPGDLDSSVLWEAINWDSYEMPPKEQMPADVIAHFKKWIEMGAPDPRERKTYFVESEMDVDKGRSHWAFQKPQPQRNATIDSLVDRQLQDAGITPVGKANVFTLLRRLNFDLTGLPPTARETQTFFAAYKKDPDQAYEAKVDQLLKRSQYGERWGRHWMDVARYAESTGEGNFSFPHAWRYRDYVIDAFNKDTPYDHFIKQQVAGDLLPAKTDEIWQENLLATGFLAIGAKKLGERNPRVFRMDMIDEQIDTVTRSVLGLTVSCARCHDHKFDPIPTADYYSLAGIFASTQSYYGTVTGQQNHQPSNLILLPLVDEKNPLRDYSASEIQEMKNQISEIQATIRKKRADANNGVREIVQQEMVSARNKISRLEGIIATLDSSGNAKTFGMGVQEAQEIRDANVLKGGDVEKPAQVVERGFLQVLDQIKVPSIQPGKSGRKELAMWLSSADNPLTARVMVNRIWMHLFGEAIVRSPNNWGLQGESPTNPELLDHLANEFMASGWSVKSLIKQIVMSRAYQRDSAFNQKNFTADPDNKLNWRMNPRQMDAESMRDSMLAVSGQLVYERPYASEIAKLGDLRFGRRVDATDVGQEHFHRSVYMPIVRDNVNESLSLFDFADPNLPAEKRSSTNVPSQALYLLNSPFVTQAAEAMAKQLIDNFDTTQDQVKWAFIQAYGRMATKGEIAAGVEFYKNFRPQSSSVASSNQVATTPRGRRGAGGRGGSRGRAGQGGPRQNSAASASKPPLSAQHQFLSLFCQSLMASAEFRILN